MAQLPASMRRRKPATTSIHDKPPVIKDRVLEWGSWLLMFLACVVLLFGGYAFYQHMKNAKIAHVDIVGLTSGEQKYLLNFLQKDTQGSYFTTDLELIRDEALKVSWVDRVVVSRAWPDTVVIRVTPRHAIARWGTGRLLSDDGMVFQPVDAVDTSYLPLLHGPATQSRAMMIKYRDITQMFQPIGLHLKELYLTERMTWFMQFDTGLRVIVDHDQTMSKLLRLSEISRGDLKPVWDQISAIDLRYRNGMAIQWKSGVAPKMQNGQFIVENNVPEVAVSTTQSP